MQTKIAQASSRGNSHDSRNRGVSEARAALSAFLLSEPIFGTTPNVGAFLLLPLCLHLVVFLFPLCCLARKNIIPGFGQDRLFVFYSEFTTAATVVASDDRDIINHSNGTNRAFRGIINHPFCCFVFVFRTFNCVSNRGNNYLSKFQLWSDFLRYRTIFQIILRS